MQSSSAHAQPVLAAIAAATQPLVDPAEIMATTARLLAEHLGVDRCAYAEIENEDTFVITGDHSRGVPSIVGRWPVAAFGPACVRAMLAGEAVVVDDVERHPDVGPEHLPAYRTTTIAAVICVPLHKDGRFTAAMAVHQRHPRSWTPLEVALVRAVAARCWEALERSRMARALAASEARYRLMVEACPEAVSVVDAAGRLVQINPAGLHLLEAVEPAQVLGTAMIDWIAPEEREAFLSFHGAIGRGERGSMRSIVVGLHGARRTVETTAVPLPTERGGFDHLAVSRDVTARVEAEKGLAESRARLDYAVRLSGIGFWYCDLPFDELIWDAQVKAHFFMSPEQRVTIEDFYDRIHPDDRAPTRSAIEASIANRTPYDIVYRTVQPHTGSIKWIRALGGTAYDEAGAALRFDGVTVDVTAEKLDQERLREQDRRKDEFLAMLAHELRNPLAPIRTGLEILRRTSDRAQAELIRARMERQTSHLVRLVDDLLDASRFTMGKMRLHRERLELSSVLEGALETSQQAIDGARHALVVRLPPEPVALEGDRTRLAQVFSNLLHNAAKYTPPGGRILVEASVVGDHLEVRVTDSGIGMSPEGLPRVFELFSQLGRAVDGADRGLGIGLALVRTIVEMHGGSVAAHSAGLGEGSTFTVRLPLAAPERDLRPVAGPPEGGATDAAPLSILVVDDNVDAAESLALLLELHGHAVRAAHDGRSALAAAVQMRPDVVFLDIGLPDTSGYDVARALRAAPGARPWIVALTGWGGEDDREKAAAAGFDHHLLKPVEVPKVVQALERARRARGAASASVEG